MLFTLGGIDQMMSREANSKAAKWLPELFLLLETQVIQDAAHSLTKMLQGKAASACV